MHFKNLLAQRLESLMVCSRTPAPIAFFLLLGKVLVLPSDLYKDISKVISILCRDSHSVESSAKSLFAQGPVRKTCDQTPTTKDVLLSGNISTTPDPHHVEVMVISPYLQTQTPRSDSYHRIEERYPLIRKSSEF